MDFIALELQLTNMTELIDIFYSLIPKSSTDLKPFFEYKETFPTQFQTQCIDTIWFLDNFCYQCNSPNQIDRRAFLDLVKRIVDAKLVDEELLQERLDVDILSQLSLLPSNETFQSHPPSQQQQSDASLFQKKIIKANTALFYKQTKFNLIRECIIGYTRLFNAAYFSADSFGSDFLTLIQSYSLDPNSILEILIDITSTDIENKFGILHCFLKFYSTQFGTKSSLNLANCIADKESKFENEGNKSNLLKLACLLIKEGFLKLSEILGYYVNQLEDISKKEISQNLPVKLDISNAASFEKHPSVVLILYHLFGFELWKEAFQLIQKSPNLLYFTIVQKKLCQFLFDSLCKDKSFDNENWFFTNNSFSYIEFCNLFQHLRKNPYFHIHVFPALLSIIIRIAKWAIENDSTEELFWFWISKEYLIQEISLLPAAYPHIIHNFDELLSKFNYKSRYFLFYAWKVLSRTLTLKKSSDGILTETRKALRRLSKETIRPIGRILGKLACRNPIIVFQCCLDQIQAYDNLVHPLVDSLKYLPSLLYDVLNFCLIEAFASPEKERLKSDGTNISDWLQNLALFTGHLYKKYSCLQLEPIFTYINSQLNWGNSLDLIIFDEIIMKMTNFQTITNITDSQLEAMSGGVLLKKEYLGTSSSSSKPLSRIVKALTENNLFFPFWILISRQANEIIYEHSFEHLKLIGGLVDKCNQVLIQFTDLLIQSEIQFPVSFSDLLNRYKVEKEIARLLLQPNTPTLSDNLFDIFWLFSLEKIHCPTDLYQSEIKKLRNSLTDCISSNSEQSSKDKIILSLEKIDKEHSHQINAVSKNITLLANTQISSTFSMAEFIAQCLLPRCLVSPVDSYYCTKFIKFIDEYHPNTIDEFELSFQFIQKTLPLLVSFTERESINYSRFFRFCLGRVICGDSALQITNSLLFTICDFFNTQEFIPIKNTILLLQYLLGTFPIVQEQVSLLENALFYLRNDSRKDIKVLATSYCSLLFGTRDKLPLLATYSSNAEDAEQLRSAIERNLREKLQKNITTEAVPVENEVNMEVEEGETNIDYENEVSIEKKEEIIIDPSEPLLELSEKCSPIDVLAESGEISRDGTNPSPSNFTELSELKHLNISCKEESQSPHASTSNQISPNKRRFPETNDYKERNESNSDYHGRKRYRDESQSRTRDYSRSGSDSKYHSSSSDRSGRSHFQSQSSRYHSYSKHSRRY